MKRLAIIGVVLMLAAVATACGGSSSGTTGGITVSEAWVRNPAIADQPGAAYLVIQNNGAAEDKLLSVGSDVARSIELHQSMESGGMMQMSPVPNIPVPANGRVELKPGGFHLMLINLTRPLQAGDKVQLTLNFEKAGKIPVAAEVKEQ
jgi:periplasmic copper chaperone A